MAQHDIQSATRMRVKNPSHRRRAHLPPPHHPGRSPGRKRLASWAASPATPAFSPPPKTGRFAHAHAATRELLAAPGHHCRSSPSSAPKPSLSSPAANPRPPALPAPWAGTHPPRLRNPENIFGPRSYGHLGYTGTSLWIDPDRQLSITCSPTAPGPTAQNQAIKQVRPKFHDAIVEALALGDRRSVQPRFSARSEPLAMTPRL